MKASTASSAILRRLSTGARRFESSMVESVLQLCVRFDARCRRRWRGWLRGMMHATVVPTLRCARSRALASPVVVGLCGLAPIGVADCRIGATVSASRATHAHHATDAAARGDDAPVPTIAAATDAYLTARAWLDADLLPRPDAPDALVELPGTAAICVLLRLDGRVVGTGEDATADRGMLRRAVGRAVSEALGDRVIRAVRAEAADRVTARLSLEVELAGPVVPLIGRTIADAARRVTPGTDGLAVVRAGAVTRAFPSRLLASDSADRPDRTIARLLLDAGLPAKDLPAFAADERVSLGRFHSVRVRADGPGARPTLVERGGRTIGIGEIRASTAALTASVIASRLAANALPVDRARPSDGAFLLGPYNPTAGVHDPPAAAELDAALAAIALADAAATDALPEAIRAAAREASRALRAGARLAEGDAGARRDAVAAMHAIACARLGDAVDEGHARLLRDACTRMAGGDGATAAADPGAPLLALVAAAALATDAAGLRTEIDAILARLLAPGRRGGDFTDAALAIAFLVGAAPDGSGRGDPEAESPVAGPMTRDARERLVGILEACAAAAHELQVRGADGIPAGGTADGARGDLHDELHDELPGDLLGGIPLPNARAALADAQCLQLAAAIALADAHLSPGKRIERADDERWLLRFLVQHVADDPWVGGFRDQAALRGLVRGSLAGDDCPPAASAVGLLFATACVRNQAPGADRSVPTPARDGGSGETGAPTATSATEAP